MNNFDFGTLEGLKVISAGSVIAAPFPCGIFAENGAEVVHIESTLAPDLLRNLGTSFSAEHRNQRAMTLNIPSPEGKEVLFKMLKDTDILIESSKGGTWKKWGLTDELLWEVNPKLIIVHISGYGQYGDPRYVSRASYDQAGQTFSGYININGLPDPNPPMFTKPYMCDYVTGLTAAWAALAAYIKMLKTGKGESIDVAQYEAQLRIQSYHAIDGLNTGKQPVRSGNPDTLTVSEYLYRCKDEWVYIGTSGAAIVRKLLELLGLNTDPDFIPSPQTILQKNKVQCDKFNAKLKAYCLSKTAKEVDIELNELQIPCTKIMTYKDMLENPHFKARETILEWDDPVWGGKMKGVGLVPKFKNNPGKIVKGSPTYGMNNEEILTELGYSEEEKKELYEKKVLLK